MIPWIKMRTNLLDDPRVRIISKAIGCNGVTVTGGLYMLWSLADSYSTDGRLEGYDASEIDKRFGQPGFADALALPKVDWLEIGDNYVLVKRFDEHNGASAKVRSQVAKRVDRHRNGNAPTVTKSLPEIEEEEDKKKDPLTPASGGTATPKGFASFWLEWPASTRKVGKTNCQRKWQRQNLESKAAEIVACLRRCKVSRDWTKEGGQFIPQPMSWLNKSPWETDPAEMVGGREDEPGVDENDPAFQRLISEITPEMEQLRSQSAKGSSNGKH